MKHGNKIHNMFKSVKLLSVYLKIGALYCVTHNADERIDLRTGS